MRLPIMARPASALWNRTRLWFTPSKEAPQPATARFEIAVGEERVPVTLRLSPRARRYTLRLKGPTGEVVVTAPLGARLRTARAFAEKHADWIAVRRAKQPPVVALDAGALIPIRGVVHRVVHAAGRGVARLEPASGDDLPCLVVTGAAAHLPRRVVDALKREARRDIEAAVRRHAAKLGVTITAVRIKDTVSRWGSCSPTGTLSFSWRLIFAPPEILDYLAAHEVAHRRQMNHGAEFWRIVNGLYPATDAAEAWLKREGRTLHRYRMPER